MIRVRGVLHNSRLLQIVGKPLDALARYAHVAGYLGNRERLPYDRTEDLPSSTRQLEWLGQAVARGQQPAIESKCLQNQFREGCLLYTSGSSTELREGRPEYDATFGATVRFQRDYDGKQPGDPVKAARTLLYVASLSEPPLRLLLGSDAYHAAEQHTTQTSAADREWKDLTISTDRSL